MKQLAWLIEFLDGKKTTIGTILGALIIFCIGRGYIQQDLADLLSYILVALGFTSNYATTRYYENKTALAQENFKNSFTVEIKPVGEDTTSEGEI